MKIERITEIDPILELIPIEQQIRNKEREVMRIGEMLLLVKESLDNPLFGFWIAYDNDKVVGYLGAIASMVKSLKRIIVWRIYAPGKEVQEKFKEILTEFGKSFKIKPGLVRMEVFKHDRVLERKGWKPISRIMEKRLY
jgi:hypothetical protein